MDAMAARMDEAEQRISDLEDELMENNEAEKKRETKAKEHNLRIRETWAPGWLSRLSVQLWLRSQSCSL